MYSTKRRLLVEFQRVKHWFRWNRRDWCHLEIQLCSKMGLLYKYHILRSLATRRFYTASSQSYESIGLVFLWNTVVVWLSLLNCPCSSSHSYSHPIVHFLIRWYVLLWLTTWGDRRPVWYWGPQVRRWHAVSHLDCISDYCIWWLNHYHVHKRILYFRCFQVV